MPRRKSDVKASLGFWTPGYHAKWVDNSEWCRKLTRTEKALWQQITEQPKLTRAGVLTWSAEELADQHFGVTPEEIEQDKSGLVGKGFLLEHGPYVYIPQWFTLSRSIRNPKHLVPVVQEISQHHRALRVALLGLLIAPFAESLEAGEPLSPEAARLVVEGAAAVEMEVPEVLRAASVAPPPEPKKPRRTAARAAAS